MSVQEILYPRCILGHKIGGFRASEGLPNKHECLSYEIFHYANCGNWIPAAIVHSAEKNNSLPAIWISKTVWIEKYKRFEVLD